MRTRKRPKAKRSPRPRPERTRDQFSDDLEELGLPDPTAGERGKGPDLELDPELEKPLRDVSEW